MSAKQTLQPPTPPSQQALGDPHVDRAPRELASYPECLFAKDMAVIFRVSVKRFYALDAEGAFEFAVNKPRIGRKTYSRDRVRQYFAGELRGLSVTRKRA